ncbi:hypothetical protein [Billgrantia endophytica]|uniref:Uncharacterized protein n=1 Tax=Billgrantia endophytica TaxID=2033802 RepID=A0A2N7TUD1_9GAMM|nr:hypothetical protein [Halomonas endophytica]PMR71781.1 hypothetical protein C1H69_22880 [Halomonas endophytica]
MKQEEYLVERKLKKESIIEQVLSGISILDTKTLKRKNQDVGSQERLLKTIIDFNNVEYTLMLDAYKVSDIEIVLYADLDSAYELSTQATAFTADNKNFIIDIKSICHDLNNGDLPSGTVINEVVEEALFRIQEKIQTFIDDKTQYKQAS